MIFRVTTSNRRCWIWQRTRPPWRRVVTPGDGRMGIVRMSGVRARTAVGPPSVCHATTAIPAMTKVGLVRLNLSFKCFGRPAQRGTGRNIEAHENFFFWVCVGHVHSESGMFELAERLQKIICLCGQITLSLTEKKKVFVNFCVKYFDSSPSKAPYLWYIQLYIYIKVDS